MKIYINQKEIEVQDNISVKELLDMQQIAIEGTAIAIDNKLVPKNEWNDRILTDGNKITIIRATFGGSGILHQGNGRRGHRTDFSK